MRKVRKPAIGARPGTLAIDPGASTPVGGSSVTTRTRFKSTNHTMSKASEN